jgi:N6-adenosine-specific RNA methylase IME4
VVSKLREHSKKPDEVYERIEKLLEGPYIELFARNKKDNWSSWGNQV